MDSAEQASIDALSKKVDDFTNQESKNLTAQAAAITDLKAKIAAVATGTGNAAEVTAAIDAITAKITASAEALKAFDVAAPAPAPAPATGTTTPPTGGTPPAGGTPTV